jgi:uncharacterized damage-inducible protein DinB
MADALASRVERVLAGFRVANARLVARLESASDGEAATPPAAGGWTPAQIGTHVATFNMLLAGLVSGARPGAKPAPPDFVERPWADIQAALTDSFNAPQSLHPPVDTTRTASLTALGQSAEAIESAFSGLTEERSVLTISHPRIGTISLVQAGDWIAAHTIRHNAQMKRALGR